MMLGVKMSNKNIRYTYGFRIIIFNDFHNILIHTIPNVQIVVYNSYVSNNSQLIFNEMMWSKKLRILLDRLFLPTSTVQARSNKWSIRGVRNRKHLASSDSTFTFHWEQDRCGVPAHPVAFLGHTHPRVHRTRSKALRGQSSAILRGIGASRFSSTNFF